MGQLRLNGLVKNFGKVEALRGVDLEVEDGEFFVLYGPSAAGKTTTFRAVAGLEKLNAGSMTLDGEDLSVVPVQRRNMAMVFQSFALYPHLTTYDNLAYPLREMKLRRAEIRTRVMETAEMLRITHTLKRKPASLSGGEQQRLAIGRAIIRRPGLFLLDEPLTNLDAKLRHDMRAEFKRLHREIGTTMLYATPDQLEALSMGQRIAVIQHGRITQVGTPNELYDRPQDSSIAQLVGDPPINLVPGTIGDGMRIELPFAAVDGARWHEPLGALAQSTEILFGIRPHDLKLVDAPQSTFAAEIEITEPQGDITILDLKANGTTLRLVVSEEVGAQYHAGDAVHVALDPSAARLFMKESGMMIA